MNINQITDEFESFYLKELREDSLEHLNYNLDNDILKKLEKNDDSQINLVESSVKIPKDILNLESNSNSTLDAPSNRLNDIFYVSSDIKRYYQIDKLSNVDNFNLKNNELINLSLTFDSDIEKSDFALLLVEYDKNKKGVSSRKYNKFEKLEFLPNKKSFYFSFFIESKQKGFIKNINFNLYKKAMEVKESFKYELENEDLYSPDDKVSFSKEAHGTKVIVPQLNRRYVYLSYKVNSNNFNTVPNESLLPIDVDAMYKFDIRYNSDLTLKVTPVIIEYNEKKKTKLNKLDNGTTFLKFQKDTKFIRLSYQLVGTGEVYLTDVKVLQYQKECNFEQPTWKNRFELDSTMNNIHELKSFRMAAIMDEFTYHAFSYETEILKLSFDNWKDEIISFQPHILFIESSWRGNDGEWTKHIAYVTDQKHSYIKDLIRFAQSKGIPVIFWNKEDPVHYDHFLETAKLCDYIFTTDKNKVKYYIRDCGHRNVYPLQFAAQPAIHNPIKILKERQKGVSFAGSYYSKREERSKDMNRLFRASKSHNLTIYDRNFSYTQRGEKLNFLFPEEFRDYIVGTLPFYKIDIAYKGYQFMININTVKDSPTMYARRVFEGLASGTPIISNYSDGMVRQFGDIVCYSEDEKEISSYLDRLSNDMKLYKKIKHVGIRRVLRDHTYKHRLKQILRVIGYKINDANPYVTFIGFATSDKNIDALIEIYNKSSYLNKNLLIITDMQVNDYSLVDGSITIMKKESVKNYFATIDELIESEYILPIKESNYYAQDYLSDLLLSLEYASADVVGKSSYYSLTDKGLELINHSKEYIYTPEIESFRCIFNINIFSKLNNKESLNLIFNNTPLDSFQYRGYKIFSTDSLNFIQNGAECETKLIEEISI